MNHKRQFEITLQSGNFRNIYFYVGFNSDLALKSAHAELAKDCKALGFPPITATLVHMKETPMVEKPNEYASS